MTSGSAVRSPIAGTAVLFAVFAIATAGTATAEERAIEQLNVAGGRQILWFVTGILEPGDKSPPQLIQWFSFLDKPADSPRAASFRPQVGRIAMVASVGDKLHVFYSDGVHYSYSKSVDSRQIRLPDSAMPLAIGSDSKASPPVLWALVGDQTADRVEAAWRAVQKPGTTRPAAETVSTTAEGQGPSGVGPSEPTSRPFGSYHLVQYDGVNWQPGFPAPADFSASGPVWLCASGNRQIVIWQPDAKVGTIRSSWQADGRWHDCQPLELPGPPAAGFAMAGNDGVVFAALIRQPVAADGLRCWLWGMHAEWSQPGQPQWGPVPSPLDEAGKPLDVPAGSVVTVFQDSLAVVRSTGRQAEVGLWSLKDGRVVRPFVSVPARQTEGRPRSGRGLVDVVILAVLMGVFVLVFRRRNQALLSPLSLPESVRVANVRQRLGGALVDMLPALVLVTWWWYKPLREFSDDFYHALGSPEQLKNLAVPTTLFWADLVFRAMYTTYCLLFELMWGFTPGKRLMGCRVAGESLREPTPLQIVARNATRMIELEPAMLFFLAIIFFTPYRQRIGDLLARTLVIEGELPKEEEETEDEE